MLDILFSIDDVTLPGETREAISRMTKNRYVTLSRRNDRVLMEAALEPEKLDPVREMLKPLNPEIFGIWQWDGTPFLTDIYPHNPSAYIEMMPNLKQYDVDSDDPDGAMIVTDLGRPTEPEFIHKFSGIGPREWKE